MGISMNPRMSGFRKWAEIHQPEKIGKTSTGANEGAIAAADGDQGAKKHRTSNRTVHHSSLEWPYWGKQRPGAFSQSWL